MNELPTHLQDLIVREFLLYRLSFECDTSLVYALSCTVDQLLLEGDTYPAQPVQTRNCVPCLDRPVCASRVALHLLYRAATQLARIRVCTSESLWKLISCPHLASFSKAPVHFFYCVVLSLEIISLEAPKNMSFRKGLNLHFGHVGPCYPLNADLGNCMASRVWI